MNFGFYISCIPFIRPPIPPAAGGPECTLDLPEAMTSSILRIIDDAEQNKEYGKEKLQIPILTIGGKAAIGNFTTDTFQKVASNVTGITLSNTGHFIPEERPKFLTKQILHFFK